MRRLPRTEETTVRTSSLSQPVSVTGATARKLNDLEERTLSRSLTIRHESAVASIKLAEVDRLARRAMTGQAFLSRWGTHLAGSDPFLAEELRPFVGLASLGKQEIIMETIADFCDEGRRRI